jgi:N-carbamoyl-L-amino-acid hydrolase
VRSQDDALLTEFDAYLANTISKIETKRGVEVTLGASTRAKAAPMADDLQDGLSAAAQAIGVATIPIPSGGGHDCATFANLGIASAMLFVRNENGSHNPNEHMDFQDFSMACNVLTSWCVAEVGTF